MARSSPQAVPPEVTPLEVPAPPPAPNVPATPPSPSRPEDVLARGATPNRFNARAGSSVRVEGSANMIHTRWQVRGEIVQGHLDTGPDFPTAPGQVGTPGPVAAAAEVFIPVTSLKSAEEDGTHYSDAMDSNMYDVLKPERQRKIYFHLTDMVLTQGAKTEATPYLLDAAGQLAVAGVTNLVIMPVQVLPLGNQKLKISGATTLKMSDYGISPPVALGGTLKTANEVKLSFEWMVGRHDSPQGSVPLVLNLPAKAYTTFPDSGRADPMLEQLQAPRPPVMVPAGLTNLASGARVTSSDPFVSREGLAKIIDGDKEAREQSIVFLRKGTQWVQLDLGARCEIFAIVLWHAHDALKACHSVVVLIADDPECRNAPDTLFNNDRVNAAGLGAGADSEYVETYQGKLIETHGVTGQYLRFYSHGSTQSALNEYTEIEVYGRRLP